MDLERLYTVQEVAKAYHVNEETIRRWVKRGDIKYTLVGPFRLKRFSPADLKTTAKEVKNGNGTGSVEAVGSATKEIGTK